MSKKGVLIEQCASFLFPFKRIRLNVLTDSETIEFIIKHNCSVARFGDGEFTLMNGGAEGFQDSSLLIKRKLQMIMNSHIDNLLLCVPIGLTKVIPEYTRNTSRFWKAYTVLNNKAIKQSIGDADKNQKYGNAFFTRFYMGFKDKSYETACLKVGEIKRIWEQREVVIVEGEYTRCGVGNDLFDNVQSLKRIICPAINAFAKYDEIVKTIKQTVRKQSNALILCCLGATATCLAYDLCVAGYQVIDLGHLDIEYEWARKGFITKQRVPGKAVNEVADNHPVEVVSDDKYISEIVACVG